MMMGAACLLSQARALIGCHAPAMRLSQRKIYENFVLFFVRTSRWFGSNRKRYLTSTVENSRVNYAFVQF